MTFTPYKVTNAPLTNSAFGNYGGRARGTTRRIAPMLLMCVHITDGDETASNGSTHATNERNYANRPNSPGPSAHDYVNRDGSVIHAIDPAKYCAWSNGDLNKPNTALAIVKTILAKAERGYNPNELFVREVELCGNRPDFPITSAQLETVAQMIAKDHIRTGIPISRATVGTHADINSVDRANCAFAPSVREARLTGLIERAKTLVVEMSPPPPTTYTQAQLEAAKAESYEYGFAAGKASIQAANADALRSAYNEGVSAASIAAATARKES